MAFPKIEGYVVTEKIGSGSYSTVYKAYTKVGARSIVAIKCVDKSRIKQSGSAVDNLVTEIRLLKTLQHPHIVHMKNFTWDDRNIYIIMEYCCGGDLSRYIHKYGRIPENRVLYFLQQLVSALKYLREKGVTHMDLKPHNLLLHRGSDGNHTLKVGDFGFATTACAGGLRGSPLYMAPEVLRGTGYDARVDLWSLGVIMYECLFGRAPYASPALRELLDKIQRQAPIEIPSGSSVSPACRELLSRLLKHDPDERISYEELFENEYLDLEHMPTRENYDKAVSLIKQAIELDCSGSAAAALSRYTAALRLLVPRVRCEPDAVRKSALAGKVASYMSRAEELKQYLRQATDTSPDPPADPPRTAAPPRTQGPPRTPQGLCCVRGNASTVRTYDFSEMKGQTPCVCARGTAICACGGASEREVKGSVEEGVITDDEDEPTAPRATGPAPGPADPPRRPGLLSRLWRRDPPPPLDDDTTEEANQKTKTQEGDGCRIT